MDYILWLVKVSHLTFKSFKAMSIATQKLYDILKYFPRGNTSSILDHYLFPHKVVGFIPPSFAKKRIPGVFIETNIPQYFRSPDLPLILQANSGKNREKYVLFLIYHLR